MPILEFEFPDPNESFVLKLPGSEVTVWAFRNGGSFTARHRSQPLTACTLEGLRDRAAEAEAEHLAKAARAKARKAAEVDPPAALTWDGSGQLLPIHVRGVDQRTGRALITRADGAKKQTDIETVLRPLTEEETAAHAVLLERHIKAAAAERTITAGRALDVLREYKEANPAIPITYDRDTAQFVATVGTETFRDPHSQAVQTSVEVYIVHAALPWRLSLTKHVVEPNDRRHDGYATRELADRAAVFGAEADAARRELYAWLRDGSRRFDFSWATGETPAGGSTS